MINYLDPSLPTPELEITNRGEVLVIWRGKGAVSLCPCNIYGLVIITVETKICPDPALFADLDGNLNPKSIYKTVYRFAPEDSGWEDLLNHWLSKLVEEPLND